MAKGSLDCGFENKARSYVYVAQLTISVSSVVLVIKHAVMFTQYSLQYLFLHYLELMLE